MTRKRPISGEYSWENDLVGKSDPPEKLGKRVSRYSFRRKRDSLYLSVKKSHLLLDDDWFEKGAESDPDLGLLGRVELQNDIRIKRAKSSLDGLEKKEGSRRASPTTKSEYD